MYRLCSACGLNNILYRPRRIIFICDGGGGEVETAHLTSYWTHVIGGSIMLGGMHNIIKLRAVKLFKIFPKCKNQNYLFINN